ncbi:MAG TPA: hypothetical protein VI756_16880 [Blastocatellia bacterium]
MAEIDWAGLLHQEDVEGLWNALFRLVSRHPAARPLRFATDETAVSSNFEINADLAQELFLELFQKQRFEHYAANNYSSSEIENELTHIELPNLVGARLRKRYPESFRMARRVSALLKTSSAFRRFENGNGKGAHTKSTQTSGNGLKADAKAAGQVWPTDKGNGQNGSAGVHPQGATAGGIDEDFLNDESWDEVEADSPSEAAPAAQGKPRRQRMVNQIYGLKRWPASKNIGDTGHFTELAKSVSVRQRDTRIVGRSGSSQIILSNKALEELIVEVLKAIDSPADVRTIRQLTLSKIPIQDYTVASLDDEYSKGDAWSSPGKATQSQPGKVIKHTALAVDRRPTPEDELLGLEHCESLGELAQDFLVALRRVVNNNPRRYERLLDTLWHCYFDSSEPSQIEIAKFLGISDSLVSNYRKQIEHELRKLSLTLEDGAVFSESLRQLIFQRRSQVQRMPMQAARGSVSGRSQRPVMPTRNRA